MPTKTERILSFLPPTFFAGDRRSVLYHLVDAFGKDLLAMENRLAPVMMSHWVDHADRSEEIIDDLAKIAALYGLCPRDDETVEQFRTHLKRFVRIYLDGTTTVRGLLRIAAESLGLTILDRDEDLDAWWRGFTPVLQTVEADPRDFGSSLFGVGSAEAQGHEAGPAQVLGTVDMTTPIDLRGAYALYLKLDCETAIVIDLQAGIADLSRAGGDEIVAAINCAANIASLEGPYLKLRGPLAGPDSRLALLDIDHDACGRILGLLPRRYHGMAAEPARITGLVDLSGGVDLTAEPLLKLTVDGAFTEEIDCAGADPANTTLDEIRDAINAASTLGDIATRDDKFLTLTSPTTGAGSSLIFDRPSGGNAREKLFGPGAGPAFGRSARAARVVSDRDLSAGVDLDENAKVRITLNDNAAKTIDCAGAEPERTTLAEIVFSINTALGAEVARHDGRFLSLVSPEAGGDQRFIFGTPVKGDATETLFGIRSHVFAGMDAQPARLESIRPFDTLNLWARDRISLAIDDNPPQTLLLRNEVPDPAAATPAMVATAINRLMAAEVAGASDGRLQLQSPTVGLDSKLRLIGIKRERGRSFVTRAFPRDDAAVAVLGFPQMRAWGTPGGQARLLGQRHLGQGVDLSQASFLRLSLDGAPEIDIDCAGKRPRATTIDEIVLAINRSMDQEIASAEKNKLLLESPIVGTAGRIRLLAREEGDARLPLFGETPEEAPGADPQPATITGDVDLLAPVDLRAHSRLRLRVDDMAPVEIDVAGTVPESTFLDEIIDAVEAVMPGVANRTEDDRLSLRSGITGPDGFIALEPARVLELVEYPPVPVSLPPGKEEWSDARHGDAFTLLNSGTAPVPAVIRFHTPKGAVAPGVANLSRGWSIRLLTVMRKGAKARIEPEARGGVRAFVAQAGEAERELTEQEISIRSREGEYWRELSPGAVQDALMLPRGSSRWLYLENRAPRFGRAHFNRDRFPDKKRLHEFGIFGVSRYPSGDDGEPRPLYWGSTENDPAAMLRFEWMSHQPGAVTVNLPADLPDRFGARYGSARYASAGDQPERYDGVVSEPDDDPEMMAARINGTAPGSSASKLVTAEKVASVALGWSPVTLPIRRPSFFTLGGPDQEARLYLAEDGVPGFVVLKALQTGEAGNRIALTAVKSGPARFDLTIAYHGGVFENARRLVLGETLPATASMLVRPSKVGVAQAKAAGVAITVTRDRTGLPR